MEGGHDRETPEGCQLATNTRLHAYVAERLSGKITRPRWCGCHRSRAAAVHREKQAASEGQDLVLGLESVNLARLKTELP